MKILSLSLPAGQITAPSGVPTGGLSGTGQKAIQVGVGVLILFTILFALFSVVWSGILWITSEGDKQKLQAARSRLAYSIFGLVVALLSALIVNLVGGFFGIRLLGS